VRPGGRQPLTVDAQCLTPKSRRSRRRLQLGLQVVQQLESHMSGEIVLIPVPEGPGQL